MQNNFFDYDTSEQHLQPIYKNINFFKDSKVGPWSASFNFIRSHNSPTHLFEKKSRHHTQPPISKKAALKKCQTQQKMRRLNTEDVRIIKNKSMNSKFTLHQLQEQVLAVQKRLPIINSPSRNFRYENLQRNYRSEEKNYWQPNSIVYMNRFIADCHGEMKIKSKRNLLHPFTLIKELNFIRSSKNSHVLKSKQKNRGKKQSKRQKNKSIKLTPIKVNQ